MDKLKSITGAFRSSDQPRQTERTDAPATSSTPAGESIPLTSRRSRRTEQAESSTAAGTTTTATATATDTAAADTTAPPQRSAMRRGLHKAHKRTAEMGDKTKEAGRKAADSLIVAGGPPHSAMRVIEARAGAPEGPPPPHTELVRFATPPSTTVDPVESLVQSAPHDNLALLRQALGRDVLPQRLLDAERALEQAKTVIQQARNGGREPTPLELDALHNASVRYDQMATAEFKAAASSGRPVTMDMRKAAANFASSLVSNFVGFTIPTAVAAHMPDPLKPYVFAGMVGLMAPAGAEGGSRAQRALGGAVIDVNWRFPGSGSGTVGPQKKLWGDFALTMLNVAVYGAVSVAMSRSGFIGNNPWGAGVRAVTSGASFSAVNAAVTWAGNKDSLRRMGAEQGEDVPKLKHDRAAPSLSMTASEPVAREDRTTMPRKMFEVGAAVLGSVLAATALGGEMTWSSNKFKNDSHPTRQLAADIFVGFTAYFLLATLARAAFTHFFNHPDRNAKDLGVIENKVAVQHIHRSGVEAYENLLDHVGKDLQDGHWGSDSKAAFDVTTRVLNGEAFRTNAPADEHHPAKQLARMLSDVAADISADLQARPGAMQQRHAGALQEVAEYLRDASASLREGADRVADGKAFQPALKNATNKLRDTQFLLMQGHLQLGATDRPADGAAVPGLEAVQQAAATLLPHYAALRGVDRDEQAFKVVKKLQESGLGSESAKKAISQIVSDSPHDRIFLADIADHIHRTGQDTDLFLHTVDMHVRTAFKGSPPPEVAAKVLLLHNAVNQGQSREAHSTPVAASGVRQRRPFAAEGEAPAAEVPTLRARTHQVSDTTVARAGRAQPHIDPLSLIQRHEHHRDDLKRVFTEAFKRSDFGPAQVLQTLNELRHNAALPDRALTDGSQDVEAGSHVAVAARRMLSAFETAMGPAFMKAVEAEAGAGLWNGAGPGGDMFSALSRDLSGMAKPWRDSVAPTLVARLPTEKPDLPQRPITDTHFHTTGYSGNVTAMEENIKYMDDNAVACTIFAGIPSQMHGMTPEALYYNNNPHKISMFYRDHDRALAIDYMKQDVDAQKRVVLCITGLDVSNPAVIGKELDQRLREFPRVFRGAGEDTWIKEIVSGSQLYKPTLEGMTASIKEHLLRGLSHLLHCDRGVPGSKDKNVEGVIKLLTDAPKLAQEWAATDPLRAKHGFESAPPPAGDLIWAHGMGKRRYDTESRDHTKQMMRDLNAFKATEDAVLAKHGSVPTQVRWDASWDFVSHDILQGAADLFAQHNVSRPIEKGLRDVISAYEAFAVVGGRSDKSADLGKQNMMSMFRVGSNTQAKHYFQAVANFKKTVEREFQDPQVRNAFANMCEHHGDHGNNWFHTMYAHPRKCLFGSDALQVAMKTHGEAAYAMNMKVMEPALIMFDELAKTHSEQLPNLVGLSKKITVDNFKEVWFNPQAEVRRHAWEDMLQKEQPAEHVALQGGAVQRGQQPRYLPVPGSDFQDELDKLPTENLPGRQQVSRASSDDDLYSGFDDGRRSRVDLSRTPEISRTTPRHVTFADLEGERGGPSDPARAQQSLERRLTKPLDDKDPNTSS